MPKVEVISYETRPPINQVELQSNPLRIWIDSRSQMRIRKGATINDVLKWLPKKWGLSDRQLRKLIAYWFALGERHAAGKLARSKWKKSELRSDPDRRYLESVK